MKTTRIAVGGLNDASFGVRMRNWAHSRLRSDQYQLEIPALPLIRNLSHDVPEQGFHVKGTTSHKGGHPIDADIAFRQKKTATRENRQQQNIRAKRGHLFSYAEKFGARFVHPAVDWLPFGDQA